MAEKSRDKEIYERLTRIETDLEHFEKQDENRDDLLADISDKLDALQIELSRYRGTVGGILLVVTAVVTAFKLFGSAIVTWYEK